MRPLQHEAERGTDGAIVVYNQYHGRVYLGRSRRPELPPHKITQFFRKGSPLPS
ncbi:hypothetical protein EVA_02420 [gut metagenome]|uniref:Uncharacterized protein n=1 Tax=gut metagenome TaxID=749906 RepID=J9GN23_9ZZZZ